VIIAFSPFGAWAARGARLRACAASVNVFLGLSELRYFQYRAAVAGRAANRVNERLISRPPAGDGEPVAADTGKKNSEMRLY